MDDYVGGISPVDPVTPVSPYDRDPYGAERDWINDPAYRQAMQKEISEWSSIDRAERRRHRQEIRELYRSLGQTPPDESGHRSF
ncbi:MAG: hypothetical protein OXF02_03925 [Simkaniaceae bacterium]|nr:hypothetical protein [Simkaniaceae bacterium]